MQINKYGFDVSKDSDITAFVKLERYYDETKSPRMIMGQNPKFNLVFSQVIDPIEKGFYQLDEVSNGKDHHAVGEMFSRMVGRCSHFIENDMSKYESSQRWNVLKWEYMFYHKIISATNPELLYVLRLCYAACLRSRVKTSLGVYMQFVFCRISGSITTALGNGFVNLMTSQYNQVMNTCDAATCGLDLCVNPGCRVKDIILKGDDSVLGANSNQVFVDYYKNFGLDAKIVRRSLPEDVEFCSGGFVEYQTGKYVYVQKLQKLLESLTTCINQDALRNGWVAHYYKSLGLMYKIVYRGVPVYEDIADFLLRTNVDYGVNVNLVTSYNLLDAYQSKHSEIGHVDQSKVVLGVSMVNKMDYSELQRIVNWCKQSKLEFPKEYRKRCKIRARVNDHVRLDYTLINAMLPSYNFLDESYHRFVKKLQSWEQCFAWNKH